MRRFEFAVPDGGTDPVAGFFDGGIWQSDDIELVETRGNSINLNLDKFAMKSDSGGGKYFRRQNLKFIFWLF
jgi:hypothetical protein